MATVDEIRKVKERIRAGDAPPRYKIEDATYTESDWDRSAVLVRRATGTTRGHKMLACPECFEVATGSGGVLIGGVCCNCAYGVGIDPPQASAGPPKSGHSWSEPIQDGKSLNELAWEMYQEEMPTKEIAAALDEITDEDWHIGVANTRTHIWMQKRERGTDG